MKFEVYCDEANPDVLTSANPRARHLMIGSLWLPEELRNEIKTRIGALRERHQAWGEIKWSKVSPNRRDFYVELIDLFFAYGDNLRFRCIAVDRTQLNLALHDNDGELGFYKFYYQLLHHWILDFNAYRIFCDVKSNRDPKRLPVLARCLARANLTSSIDGIQSLPCRVVVDELHGRTRISRAQRLRLREPGVGGKPKFRRTPPGRGGRLRCRY